jgi:hypothetical protein
LVVPENIHVLCVSGYTPILNLQKHLWEKHYGNEFPNRMSSDRSGVVRTMDASLPRLASDRDRV